MTLLILAAGSGCSRENPVWSPASSTDSNRQVDPSVQLSLAISGTSSQTFQTYTFQPTSYAYDYQLSLPGSSESNVPGVFEVSAAVEAGQSQCGSTISGAWSISAVTFEAENLGGYPASVFSTPISAPTFQANEDNACSTRITYTALDNGAINLHVTNAKGATVSVSIIGVGVSALQLTPSPSPSPSPTKTPSPTPSPSPTKTPTPTSSPSPSPAPAKTPSPTPSTTPSPSPTPTPTPTSPATWSAFMGANNLDGSPWTTSMGIGWVRFGNECSWPTTEPTRGTFNFTDCDNSVNTAIQQKLHVVMMLAYFPGWAGNSNGTAVANPQDAYNWAATMVQRYMAKGVTYFQIANEPTSQAGFWSGTDQQLVNSFLGPIQQAVKDNGGVVLSPAWPASNSVTELINNVLNAATPGGTYTNDTAKKIYQTVDMVDLHYAGLSAWQAVWNAFPAGTFKGMFQSEFGFSTGSGILSANYVEMLYWALSPSGGNWQNAAGPTAKYAFGLAWYAECCATNGGTAPVSNNLTTDGTTLTENGMEAAALNTALSGGPLTVYTNYSGVSNAYAFNVGSNITVALFNSGTQTLKASGFAAQPASVSAIDYQGNSLSVSASYSAGTETVTVAGKTGGVYVVIKR